MDLRTQVTVEKASMKEKDDSDEDKLIPDATTVQPFIRKQKVLFAVDIECSGGSFSQNGIIAIGYCVGTLDGQVLEKKRISMSLLKRVFEPRCWNEYWVKPKQAEQLKEFQKYEVHPFVAMTQFISAVDRYEDKYDVTILTDNPAYDIAWLNMYLDLYLGRLALAYTKNQVYRGVKDPYEWAMKRKIKTGVPWSFNTYKYNSEIAKLKELHDHWPENDAESIFRQALLLDGC